MVLNLLFISFFLVGFLLALYKLIFLQDLEVFKSMTSDMLKMSKTGFEIALYLTGGMCLWLGLMRVGEKGGVINFLARLIGPFFSRIFPDIPKGHPAFSAMLMNFSANLLGLDNAATPLGLKAMKELESVNPKKGTASNAQIMFLVLNTSGLTIIPVSILVIRSQYNSLNPADVFLPILLATSCSTLAALILVGLIQKINFLDPVLMFFLVLSSSFVGGVYYIFSKLGRETVSNVSASVSGVVIFSIISSFIILALIRRVNVYEVFIEGAKEGFSVAIMIIPYLVAILASIAVFRASGAMDFIMLGFNKFFSLFDMDTRFVEALPNALLKPFSGSGARGMMIDVIEKNGVDSFVGRLVSCFQGSTETTFYTIAVYYGAVGIRRTRYTAPAGLFADFIGIISAIIIAYLFFG